MTLLPPTTLAPVHIERLLWYHYRCEDWPIAERDQHICALINMGMLEHVAPSRPADNPLTLGLTPKGKAYVQAILDLSPDAKPAKRSRSVSCHLGGITVTITEEPTE